MRRRLFGLFALAALSLFLLGCSEWLGKSPERPTPVILPRATELVYPLVPGVHRYVEPGDRLSFPTPTLAPSPTPRLTRDLSRSRAPVRTPAAPTATPETPGMVWQGDTLSCVDRYRRMLIGYEGRIPFGAQVAWSLSEDFKGLHLDCVDDEGWTPLFDTGVVCRSGSIAGVGISRGLTYRLNSISRPQALPTGRDGNGNILVHFERVPLVDRPGCWYYNSVWQSWAWSIVGVGSGVDQPRFPDCDRLLRSLSAAMAAGDQDFASVHVVRALDEVRRELPYRCGSLLWNPFPGLGSHEDCGVPGDTGLNEDGVLVVTWHPGYLPADGSVCWTLAPDSEYWEFFYPEEEDE